MDTQGPTFDRDDWEDLKDLFSKATELYQSTFDYHYHSALNQGCIAGMLCIALIGNGLNVIGIGLTVIALAGKGLISA